MIRALIMLTAMQAIGQPIVENMSAVKQDSAILSVICFTNRLAPLTKTQWERVNIARSAQSMALFSYDVARTNAGVNEPYFIMLLTMIETEISEPFLKANGRVPAMRDVLAAWAVGVPRFAKLRYDATKIREPAVQLLLKTLDYEKRLLHLSRINSPPPLPEAKAGP